MADTIPRRPGLDAFFRANGGAAVDEFTPNGLLGDVASEPGPSTLRGESPAGMDGDDGAFVSNGLLAGEGFPGTQTTLLEDDGFAPTGLLGGLDATPSQDDLPSISQVIGRQPAQSIPRPAFNLPRARPDPNLVRACTYEGKPIYLRRKTQAPTRRPLEATTTWMDNLLDAPIHRLMEQVSEDAARKLLRSDAAIATASTTSTDAPEDTLWVDRYRPKRFLDLIGDERVHRETLAWVKEWDFCVFGKRKGKGVKRAWEGDEAKDDDDGEWKKDEFQRPKERILLLSGPAGLGKTTLAHVVARQAGYRVFEINASDARSGQVVEDRIRPALESGGRIGSSKPSLVVIDEIDGATGAGDQSTSFIQKLVDLTLDHHKSRKKSRKRDGKPNTDRPLLRPIICICNDLYASALAKLRPHARIIRFNRPADVTLVKRLRTICEAESLRADSRALTALVGVAKGDMRSCLNALQFIKSRNSEVTETVIRSATNGMKEADTSFLTVLNEIFSPMTRKRAKELGLSEEEEGRYLNRLSRAVEATGSMDKVAQGCFEHYANLRKHDASFTAYHRGEEWLLTFDAFTGAMRNNGDYALMAYLSYPLVAFYPLFQERGGPRVERPKADWEAFLITRTNEEIYKSLSRCLRTASATRNGDFRHLASSQILQLEFAPLINRIISPPLRPVNSQVIRPEEKALLSRLVEIMVSLELRFVKEKTEDGQAMYRLDPPVDVFVTYEGKRAADIAVSRYASRHLVAAEIDAQLIVRQAETLERHKKSRPAFFGGKSDHVEVQEHGDEDHEADDMPVDGTLVRADLTSSEQQPAKRQRVAAIDIADKPPMDFFGRVITVAASNKLKSRQGAVPKTEKKLGVSFRFNEGNSAAVRRPVKVSTFM